MKTCNVFLLKTVCLVTHPTLAIVQIRPDAFTDAHLRNERDYLRYSVTAGPFQNLSRNRTCS